jgi:hypothetical protein
MDEDNYLDRLRYYQEIGVITLEGMDENGEPIYAIHESAEELAPELWESHINHIDNALTKLFEEGLLEIEYDEDLEPMFRISKGGYERAKEYGLIDFPQEDIPND